DLVPGRGDCPTAQRQDFRGAVMPLSRIFNGDVPLAPARMFSVCKNFTAQGDDEVLRPMLPKRVRDAVDCETLGDAAKVQRQCRVSLAKGVVPYRESASRRWHRRGYRPEPPAAD